MNVSHPLGAVIIFALTPQAILQSTVYYKPCHEPHKLIKAYRTIPILVYFIDHLLEMKVFDFREYNLTYTLLVILTLWGSIQMFSSPAMNYNLNK